MSNTITYKNGELYIIHNIKEYGRDGNPNLLEINAIKYKTIEKWIKKDKLISSRKFNKHLEKFYIHEDETHLIKYNSDLKNLRIEETTVYKFTIREN